MGLSPAVLRAITRKGYRLPTPIQRRAMPLILQGLDLVGMARTGSGKTAAFVIPMIERCPSHGPHAHVAKRACMDGCVRKSVQQKWLLLQLDTEALWCTRRAIAWKPCTCVHAHGACMPDGRASGKSPPPPSPPPPNQCVFAPVILLPSFPAGSRSTASRQARVQSSCHPHASWRCRCGRGCTLSWQPCGTHVLHPPTQAEGMPAQAHGAGTNDHARPGPARPHDVCCPGNGKLCARVAGCGWCGLQTHKAVRDLGRFTNLRTAVLVGGDAMEVQFAELATNPDAIVATPGRLLHHLQEVRGA